MTYTPADHTFAVCAYKESPYLADCIKSLKEQTLPANIIIATSTPNDHIRSLADEHDIPLYVSGNAPSISSDWNHAISRVGTPLVTIAHQDDVYLPRYLESMLEGMSQANDPLIGFTDYGEIRNGRPADEVRILNVKRKLLAPLTLRPLWGSRFARRRILSLGSAICCPSVTYNLERLSQPIFSNELKCDLDWQAWERISRLKGDFVYRDEILMRHRIHEGSETTELIRDDTRSREDLYMLNKFWPAPIAVLVDKVYSKSEKSNEIS